MAEYVVPPRSPEVQAKDAAGRAAIAAKYGEKPQPDINARPAPLPNTIVHEPSVYERAAMAELEEAEKQRVEAQAAAEAVIAAQEPVKKEVPKVVEQPKVEKPAVDPNMALLLERVASLSDKLAAYEKADRTEKKAPVRIGPVSITEEEWNRDPTAAIAKFKGWDEERMAQHLMVKKGDLRQLDPRIIANVGLDRVTGELTSKINELTAEIQNMKDAAERDVKDKRLENDVAVVEAKEYPHTAKAKAKNSDKVARRVRAAASALRAQNNGADPSVADILKLVEAELAEVHELLAAEEPKTTEGQKKVEQPDNKNDEAPALTADNTRASFSDRSGPKTWAQQSASIVSNIKAKYERAPQ